ncbi:MAG: hypothetical protein JW840_05485 [Candidatus Thermoplasmatota archaeon]|nr:hypothetical protein [Candidatus Thermoplasmatota archaeon]
MKKRIVIVCVCMLLTVPVLTAGAYPHLIFRSDSLVKNGAYSTGPVAINSWTKTFGGWRRDAGFSIQQTMDGGFIIVGVTESYGAGKNDVWLIKTDSSGDKSWDKTFGGTDRDFGNSVQQTKDGGYIIAGETRSYGNGLDDVWLIKTDSDGEMIWDTTFGYDDSDSASQVRQTNDGGFIIVGDVNNNGGGVSDVWVIKTDTNGEMVWNRTFDGKGKPISHDYGTSIALTSDGGYIITAATFTTQDTYGYNIWLIKIDENGNTLWDKNIGGADGEYISSVIQTNDGGFVMVGVDSYSNSNESLWILKTDGNGEFLWEQKYTGVGMARGESIQQTSDGGYIVVGFTYTKYTRYRALIIKTDSDGEYEWSSIHFSWLGNCIAFSVQETSDGGYIVVGDRRVLFKTMNLWLLKLYYGDGGGEKK